MRWRSQRVERPGFEPGSSACKADVLPKLDDHPVGETKFSKNSPSCGRTGEPPRNRTSPCRVRAGCSALELGTRDCHAYRQMDPSVGNPREKATGEARTQKAERPPPGSRGGRARNDVARGYPQKVPSGVPGLSSTKPCETELAACHAGKQPRFSVFRERFMTRLDVSGSERFRKNSRRHAEGTKA